MATQTKVRWPTPANRDGRSFEVGVGDLVKTDGSAGPLLAFVVERLDHMGDRPMFRGRIRGRDVWCLAEEVGSVEHRWDRDC